MDVAVQILEPGDEPILKNLAADVFDASPEPGLVAEFLRDPRHHLAVAIMAGKVVGFASAVHYVHPDKPPELWIIEVGVTPAFRGRGLGRRLMDALFALGLELGCREAWVLTEPGNEHARGFYAALGGQEGPAVMFSFSLKDLAR